MTTSEVDKFTQAQNIARRLGFIVRKADNANDVKAYTLVRNGMETHFATIDDVIAKLKKVKPVGSAGRAKH